MSRWMLLMLLCGWGCKDRNPLPSSTTETGVTDAAARSVVVLVMDGVRIDESFGDGDSSASGTPTAELMPSLRQLVAQEGALVTRTFSTGLTRTGPGHVDLVVGRHLPHANYPVDADGVVGDYLPELPTLYESLEPGEGWLIGNGKLIAPAARSVYSGNDHSGAVVEYFGPSDPGLLLELRSLLTDTQPRLVVVNLHDVDRAGHSGEDGESGEPRYVENSRQLGDEIARFWSWLQDQPDLGSKTTVLITADHGRHRLGGERDWAEHGDQCTGCRQIPLALLGSGIQPGVVVNTPHTMLDINQTIAALLAISMPYSQGSPIREVLTENVATTGAAAGALFPDAVDGIMVFQENLDGEVGRSRIVDSNGNVLSADGAWLAEEPTLASHNGSVYAAWRELAQPGVGAAYMPWKPASARWDGSQWVSIPLTFELVSSYWKPELVSDGTLLWLLSIDNPNGMTINGVDPLDVRLLRLSPTSGSWVSAGSLVTPDDLSFPSHISAQIEGSSVYYAVSSADPRALGRFTRRIEVYGTSMVSLQPQRLFAAGPEATASVSIDAVVDAGRLERPALWVSENQIHLAMLAYRTDAPRVALLLASSMDGGETWLDLVQTSIGPVLGHISPSWSADGTLSWMELDGDDAMLCRLPIGGDVQCTSTGHAYVEGLNTTEDQAWLSARSDAREPWTVLTLP